MLAKALREDIPERDCEISVKTGDLAILSNLRISVFDVRK
jgi:hypothetical protein